MAIVHSWGFQSHTKSIGLNTSSEPSPKADEILIKNHAIGINPVDWKLIQANPLGWYDGHIPGVDGAGEVVAVGSPELNHLMGKRVCYHAFLKTDGSFTTHITVKAKRVMILPNTVKYPLAASLPCPMLTAFQAFEKIPVQAEKTVLIGGMGAVTKILAQLLVKQGMHVDVVSKHLRDAEAKSLGIRTVFSDLTTINQKNYFAAFDAVGEENAKRLVRYLQANGHIVCIQDRINQAVDDPFTRTISYHEIALGALHEFGTEQAWQDLMAAGEALINDIAQSKLQVSTAVEFSFEQLKNALSHSEKSKEKSVVIV